MKVIRENQGDCSSTVYDLSFYVSIIYSYCRGRGDWIWKDDPVGSIPLRRWLL